MLVTNQIKLKYPLWISWELTNKCNYSCIHCRMDSDEEVCVESELSTQEIINCIDQFAEIGICQIGFSGGEPFCREDIFDILNYASSVGIKVGITTNGYFINDSIIYKLLNIRNLEFVQISLDGKNAETHDYIRQHNGAFTKATVAIKKLVSAGIRTGVVTTVMKTNMDQINEIATLIKNLGANMYGARRFMSVGKGSKMCESLLLSSKEYQRHCEYWHKRMNSCESLQYTIEEPLLSIINMSFDINSIGCTAGNTYGAITAIGDIRPCIFIPVSLGNIRKDSFKNIWNNSDIRKKIVDRELNGKCRECDLKDRCGGCRAASYAMSGDLFGYDPLCFK